MRLHEPYRKRPRPLLKVRGFRVFGLVGQRARVGAWVQHVLMNPDSPDLDAYLAQQFNADI